MRNKIISVVEKLKRGPGNRVLLFAAAFVILFLVAVPNLFAIHAIFEDGEPIQRKHGPIFLKMPLDLFLQKVDGTEESPAIGQFEHEQRFRLDGSSFRPKVESVIADFYSGILFRIEINFQPVHKTASPLPRLKEEWSHRYGPPRANAFPGVDLLFWDDGKTRMILEAREEETAGETSMAYSLTYIDDDLFHRASRERVQLETDGRSSYGN
ncbi:MAG: hypothetical protein ACE5J1_00115 [Nitrospiria bacterium]